MILLLSTGPAFAQTHWQWTHRNVAAEDPDRVRGRSIATDAAGNVYVAGSFSGTTIFGETNAPITSFGLSDAFLARYDRLGVLQWVRKFGGSGFDAAHAVTLDATGNIYLAGGYVGPVVFDSYTLTNPAAGFIAKIDAVTARVLWVRDGGLEWTAIAVDAAGNIHVTGPSLPRIESGESAPADASAAAGEARSGVVVASFSPAGVLVEAPEPGASIGGVPRLESVTVLEGGLVQLRFASGTGQSIITEASSRLPDWVPVSTNVPSGGVIRFADPGAAGVSGRFYRLKMP